MESIEWNRWTETVSERTAVCVRTYPQSIDLTQVPRVLRVLCCSRRPKASINLFPGIKCGPYDPSRNRPAQLPHHWAVRHVWGGGVCDFKYIYPAVSNPGGFHTTAEGGGGVWRCVIQISDVQKPPSCTELDLLCTPATVHRALATIEILAGSQAQDHRHHTPPGPEGLVLS